MKPKEIHTFTTRGGEIHSIYEYTQNKILPFSISLSLCPPCVSLVLTPSCLLGTHKYRHNPSITQTNYI